MPSVYFLYTTGDNILLEMFSNHLYNPRYITNSFIVWVVFKLNPLKSYIYFKKNSFQFTLSISYY